MFGSSDFADVDALITQGPDLSGERSPVRSASPTAATWFQTNGLLSNPSVRRASSFK
jgi:hypothetical protein